MLTVRIVRDAGLLTEYQHGQEIESWALRPGNESPSGNACFTLWDKKLNATDVFDGDIYVMNESGKTVADYHLHYLKSDISGEPFVYPNGGTLGISEAKK